MPETAGAPRVGAGPLDAPLPHFSAQDAAQVARDHFQVLGSADQLVSERDQNFRITGEDGCSFLLKIHNAAEDPGVVDMQTQAMLHVRRTDPSLPIMTPVPDPDGALHRIVTDSEGIPHIVRLLTFLAGEHLEGPDLDREAIVAFGVASARLGRSLRGFFHPAAGHTLLWNLREAPRLRGLLPDVDDQSRRRLLTAVLDGFEARALPRLPGLRAQVIHGDVSLDNTLFDRHRRVSGILDFGDMMHAATVADLLASAELVTDRDDPLEALAALCQGFSSVTPLEPEEVELLPDLLSVRWATSATLAAWRQKRYPACADYVRGWERGVWSMFARIEAAGPDRWRQQARDVIAAAVAGAAPVGSSREPPRSRGSAAAVAAMAARRRRLFGPAISPLSYDRPLHLVGGSGVWLSDAEGRTYLDAYNNVPVVGHCHPRVVAAVTAQVARLNTNVRYLHESALALAERLIAALPEGLDTVMFVNSGSEANDLAWRLATCATGGSGGLVTRSAYHGVTRAVAELSPAEWRTPDERPPHVALLPPPDGYRGRHRADQPGWGERYAEAVDTAVAQLARDGHRPAAMFIDAGFTSEGILRPPPTYLQEAVRRWRAAGGLFVGDEVQTGFGRPGTHLWGFQVHGVVPDIVTLGKPMGNGHPVAAVVTRAEIAQRFAEATEWFSTFGGNPVACAAGLAVLAVIDEEKLVQHADAMGHRLGEGLAVLAARHPVVGEVRRMGLLVGVELVRDRGTRDPAPGTASAVINRMRDQGVLIGNTGPEGNVLKIRPPLVIQEPEVDRLLAALDEGLGSVTIA
ncbi:MAG TPA: aminotransferase class III-fold pyridoxal phosphate-dependent enzyme [Verrucomicrobiae bacterium]|nr:aminotransferase class III-fold pyridoxal phosphate-dependent enzyme [Verrucomicrobiae bacterium]